MLREDRDVLTKPLRRRGNDFEEIGWDEALDLAAERFKDIFRSQALNPVFFTVTV